MTKLKTILVALMATMTMAIAGGDIAPIGTPVAIEAPQKNFYVGVNTLLGSGIDYGQLNWFESTTLGVQGGIVAYRAGDFSVSVEGRYTTDTQDWFDIYTWGGFVKPAYDFGFANVYGLVGYTQTSVFGQDEDGIAYGAGVSKEIVDNYEVFVDYIRNDYDNTPVDVVTLGVNYKF